MKANVIKDPSKDWRDLQSEDSISNLSLSYSNTKILTNDKNNTSIASLKDSIQKELKSYKQYAKKKNNNNTNGDSNSLMKSSMNMNNSNLQQPNSEKEKLNNYFQSIKHTWVTSSTTCNNAYTNTNINTNTQSNIEPIQRNDNNTSNHNFIIFEAFKNMMSKGGGEAKKATIQSETPRLPSELALGEYDNNYHSNNIVFNPTTQNDLMTDNEQLSIINDLQSIKIEESNPNRIKESNANSGTMFTLNSEFTNIDKTNKEKDNKNIGKDIKKKDKSNEAFYKKKYFQLKSQMRSLRLKLNKEKNISEMLTLKLFYETNKKDPQAMNQGKITQMLTEKIKENVVIFDKLEEEIAKKEKVIQNKDEVISRQKDIIDKLMRQINNESIVNNDNS